MATTARAELGLLHRPDGSASYSHNGYSVLAAVNGPIEVQRRDEIPDEAALDVTVRPASGVGAIRERYFETIISNVLRRAIYTKAHPRTLIQVTLQITSTPPENASSTGKLPQAALNLSILPPLLNAAMLALLAASVPMLMTFAAAGFVVDREGKLFVEPSPKQIHEASSVHVFCFSTTGAMLLYLCEGAIEIDDLPTIESEGRHACIGSGKTDSDRDDMDVDENGLSQAGLIRSTVLRRLQKHEAWRERS